jgi:drug/metabolite transporter (DMT)-like permease
MQKKIALIFVTLSALFWGTNFNIGKTLIEQISPLTAAALRFSFASLLMMPFIVCLNQDQTSCKP